VEAAVRGAAALTAEERAPIELLGEILGGRRPLEDARTAFADEVIMHADHYSMRGSAEGWMRWVAFMWDRSQLGGLRGEFDALTRQADGTLAGTGRWYGHRDGHEVRSLPVTARYRVVDGRIVEMWSVRRNYTSILGDGFDTPVGFWLIIARFGLWSLRWKSRQS
jgi:limonene-1,2-epoxide hydrolase